MPTDRSPWASAHGESAGLSGSAFHRSREQVPPITDTIRNSPWPDLFRPPTSSKKAVWTAVKAWMTGTSPVKGAWSCPWVLANNRLLSTGQPWAKPGQDEIGPVRRRSQEGEVAGDKNAVIGNGEGHRPPSPGQRRRDADPRNDCGLGQPPQRTQLALVECHDRVGFPNSRERQSIVRRYNIADLQAQKQDYQQPIGTRQRWPTPSRSPYAVHGTDPRGVCSLNFRVCHFSAGLLCLGFARSIESNGK